MQHYDLTPCVTGTGLSHEPGALRRDGLRPDAQLHHAKHRGLAQPSSAHDPPQVALHQRELSRHRMTGTRGAA
jgi:hypothetical protein